MLKLANMAIRTTDIPVEIRRRTHRGCGGRMKRPGKRVGSRQQRPIERKQIH